MPEKNLSRAAALMVLLVILVIGGWELYLRHSGERVFYDNGRELWADKRAMVYEPPEKTVVFIGTSRMKYDLDINTWQQLTGKHAVQLAIEGSSPLHVLMDLGNDRQFCGRLVIDGTEFVLFSNESQSHIKPDDYISYYKSETPAQKASFVIDHALESQLVFLDRDELSLDAGLKELPLSDRPGVIVPPEFPRGFHQVSFDRQNTMSETFLRDTGMQGRTEQVWANSAKRRSRSTLAARKDSAAVVLAVVKDAVEKIRARGGEVVFIRPPSSGPLKEEEKRVFPRERCWEPMLATTHCMGIHYADDTATDHFICPEWSHLSPGDAILYTRALVRSLPAMFVRPVTK